MRYILFDFMHSVYKSKHLPPLTMPVTIDGVPMYVDTTMANFVIKDIFNKSQRGRFFIGVFLEGTASGALPFRKEYFQSLAQIEGAKGVVEEGYKGTRKRESSDFYTAVELTQNLLMHGGVSLYRVEKLEADDVIAAMVRKIKTELGDTTTPIDIITNDNDYLPLVDDQVSVYIRSKREYSEPGDYKHRGYFQVTPNSWDEYIAGSSAFKDCYVPYNSVILYKLMKGDPADEYKGAVKGYGKVTYTKLMNQMIEDGVDFENIFRYWVNFDEVMRPVLEKYFPLEEVDRMGYIYRGMNMIESVDGVNWLHHKLNKPLQINIGELQKACNTVGITIVK